MEPPHRCRRHAWLDRHGNDETVRGHTGAVSFTSPQSLGEADTPCEAAPQGPPAPAGGEGGLRAGRSTGRREAPRGHRDGRAPTRTFPEDWWATATKAHWEGRERKRGRSQEAAAAKRGCRSRQGRGERGKQGASTSKSAGDSRCCEQVLRAGARDRGRKLRDEPPTATPAAGRPSTCETALAPYARAPPRRGGSKGGRVSAFLQLRGRRAASAPVSCTCPRPRFQPRRAGPPPQGRVAQAPAARGRPPSSQRPDVWQLGKPPWGPSDKLPFCSTWPRGH